MATFTSMEAIDKEESCKAAAAIRESMMTGPGTTLDDLSDAQAAVVGDLGPRQAEGHHHDGVGQPSPGHQREPPPPAR